MLQYCVGRLDNSCKDHCSCFLEKVSLDWGFVSKEILNIFLNYHLVDK
jgi:hypothetical protein